MADTTVRQTHRPSRIRAIDSSAISSSHPLRLRFPERYIIDPAAGDRRKSESLESESIRRNHRARDLGRWTSLFRPSVGAHHPDRLVPEPEEKLERLVPEPELKLERLLLEKLDRDELNPDDERLR